MRTQLGEWDHALDTAGLRSKSACSADTGCAYGLLVAMAGMMCFNAHVAMYICWSATCMLWRQLVIKCAVCNIITMLSLPKVTSAPVVKQPVPLLPIPTYEPGTSPACTVMCVAV